MYWLMGPALAFIGIVNALPEAQLLAKDRALQRRQANACVAVGSNRTGQECIPVYSVDPSGQTVVEAVEGTVTLPTGSSDPITATFSNGDVTTITPSAILINTSNSLGNTVFWTNSTVTIPAGSTTALGTGLPNNETTTITPQSNSTSGDAKTSVVSGHTVVSQGQGTITLPTGLTTPLETTLPDGESTTIRISATNTSNSVSNTTFVGIVTSTSDGVTIVFGEQGTLTLPTALTTPVTTTWPDGEETVITFPSTTKPAATSSDSSNPFIFPVTTSVPKPKPTDGGIVIPCDLWFFSACIQWERYHILGWQVGLPPGIYPPGPPPPISVDSQFPVNIGITGTLPNWPTLTVGPDNLPTYEPEPDDCETETAEICVTSTSYDVSPSGTATITTGSSVFSTCGTVMGCNLEDKESSTATTSTAVCSETAACDSCLKLDMIHYDAAQYVDVDVVDVAAPVARAVQPGPVQTRSPTTLLKREKTLSDVAPPSITPPLALYKRTKTDTRVSSSFGGCALKSTITFGDWLDPQDFTRRYWAAASSYFLVSQKSDIFDISTDDDGVEHTSTTCVAGYMYSTSDYSQATRAAGQKPYMSPGGPRFNADHVYEQQLFGYFFEHALSLNGAPDCTQFNDLFVDTGLLQKISNASITQLLPPSSQTNASQNGANTRYADFAALDIYFNQKKGVYFNLANSFPKPVLPSNPGGPNYNAKVTSAVTDAANAIQDQGVVAQLMGLDGMTALFRTTHERLYQLFGEIDYNLKCSNRGQAGASPTWAATYSVWMTSWLSSRNDVFTTAASSWYSILSNQPAPALFPYTQLTASYPAASFGMPIDAMASHLKPFTPAGLEKRQDACTLDPSDTNSGSSNTASEPATTLTNLPTLTTGITTPPGSSCVSTFTQTACAPGSGEQSVCVTTPACGSWTATDAPTTTSTEPTPPSDTATSLSMAIYKHKDCTGLIDEFEIVVDTNCATHLKNNGDTKHFKCFMVKGVNQGTSNQQLELTVYKHGHCTSGGDNDRKVYTDLDAIVDKGQAPFKMGGLGLKAGAT